MRSLAKKSIKVVSLWFVIITVIYFLFNLTNKDAATVALRVNNITVTSEAVKLETARLGLDQPLGERYFNWLNQLFHGNFGQSFISGESVRTLILRALPYTFVLACGALLLIIGVIYLYGYLTIKFNNHPLDKSARVILFIINAIPAFWLGLILIELFAVKMNLFPVNGTDNWASIVLPIITLAAIYVGTYARLIRSEILKNRDDLYLQYYYLRGFSMQYCQKRLFHNSLRSVFKSLSISIPKIIAGSAVVELLFGWPGLGQLCVTAIQNRDLPVLEGYVAILALIFLIFGEIFDSLSRYFVPEKRS